MAYTPDVVYPEEVDGELANNDKLTDTLPAANDDGGSVSWGTSATNRYILLKPGAANTTSPNQTGTPAGIAAQGFGWNIRRVDMNLASWTVTHLTQGGDGSNLSTYVLGANVVPTANRLVVIGVTSAKDENPVVPSISAYGLSWVHVGGGKYHDAATGIDKRIDIFAADSGAAPTSTQVTVSFGVAHDGCCVVVAQITGSDMAAGVAQTFENLKLSAVDPAAATSGSVTFDATPAGSSLLLALVSHEVSGEDITPGDGFVALTRSSFSPPAVSSQFEYATAHPDAVVDASWATSSVWGILAVEVVTGTPGRRYIVAGDWNFTFYLDYGTADAAHADYGIVVNVYRLNDDGTYTFLFSGTSATKAPPAQQWASFNVTVTGRPELEFGPNDTLHIEVWCRGRGGGSTGLLVQTAAVRLGPQPLLVDVDAADGPVDVDLPDPGIRTIYLQSAASSGIGVAALGQRWIRLSSKSGAGVGIAAMTRTITAFRSFLVVGVGISSAIKYVSKSSFAIVGTGIASVLKYVGLVSKSTVGIGVATLGPIYVRLASKAGTAIGVATVTRTITAFRFFSVTAIGVAILGQRWVRLVSKSVIGIGIASMSKLLDMFRSFAIAGVGVATLGQQWVRLASKSAIGIGVATSARTISAFRAFVVQGVSIAILGQRWIKLAAKTSMAIGVASMSKFLDLFKAFVVQAVGTAHEPLKYVRLATKIAVGIGVANSTRTITVFRDFVAQGVGIAVLGQRWVRLAAKTSIAVGMASMSKFLDLFRVFVVQSVGIAYEPVKYVRLSAKTAIGVGVASVSKFLDLFRSFIAQAIGVATSARSFIAVRVFQVQAIGVAMMSKFLDLARSFSVVGVGVASVLKYVRLSAMSALGVGVAGMTRFVEASGSFVVQAIGEASMTRSVIAVRFFAVQAIGVATMFVKIAQDILNRLGGGAITIIKKIFPVFDD